MRRHAKAFIAVVVAIFALALPSAALASQTHVFKGDLDTSVIADGLCCLSGVAVDQSGGDLYFLDQTAPPGYAFGALHRFDNTGAFETTFTAAGALSGPQFVAIDNSATASGGTIYVANTGLNQVLALDQSGTPAAGFGAGGTINGAEDSLGDPDTVPTGGFSYVYGLAVDPTTGNLFVSDLYNNKAWIFDATGKYLAEVSDPAINGPGGLGFDSTGDLYLRNANDGTVLRFNQLSATTYAPASVLYDASAGAASDVAVDPSTNHVFVDLGDRIREYDGSGAEVATFGNGHLGGSTAIAADGESGRLYALVGNTVHTFGPLVTVPDSTTGAASGLATTTATLHGQVDPDGVQVTACSFEYGINNLYGESAACAGDAGAGSGNADVSAALTGLKPNTTYHFRLTASNANGAGPPGSDQAFTTDPAAPQVSTGAAVSTGEASRKLAGTVNANNSPTLYWFEYGAAGDCASNPCLSAPLAQDANAGNDGEPLEVVRYITGLTPGTYHYRLLAKNAVGTTEGADMTFTVAPASTPGSEAGLPDGRAYELVSPSADKNGADVLLDTQRTRAADDGNAIQFASLGAFGDAIGTGVATDYMALRDGTPGTNGWATHAITPQQAPLSINSVLTSDPLYVGDFSGDLSHGVFKAWSPLTDDPSVEKTTNLYLRDDLRTPGQGHYRLLTPCPLCDSTESPLPPLTDTSGVPIFAGASSDFRHILFESQASLTDDTASGFGPRTYEWSDGQLSYVGYVPADPDISCGGSGPSCVPSLFSLPAHGVGTLGLGRRPIGSISAGGSRAFFTVPSGFFDRAGRIYMRTDNTTTDEITASERAVPDAPAPSAFAGASADGSRVVFSSGQALTDDAPVNGDGKLYLYDATKPASDPHNLTLINLDQEPADTSNELMSVVAISDDASYVYFVATGQLIAGKPLLGGGTGLYVWHDGTLGFIGKISRDGLGEISTEGENYPISPPQSRITPDGRFLLFPVHDGSGFSLGYDHGGCQGPQGNGCRELYLYDADTGALTCPSCRSDGTPPTTEALTGIRLKSAASTAWHLNRALSDDGSRVFFTSAEPLLPRDTNGRNDVYQYDVPTGRLHLITSGTEPADAYFMDASPDGRNLFFRTRERLVGWDTDDSYDLYDARVGGGFPEPVPPPRACSGPACQGAPPAPPGALATGTASLQAPGNGNARRSRRCTKSQRKAPHNGKARCLKQHRKHKRSNGNRRAAK